MRWPWYPILEGFGAVANRRPRTRGSNAPELVERPRPPHHRRLPEGASASGPPTFFARWWRLVASRHARSPHARDQRPTGGPEEWASQSCNAWPSRLQRGADPRRPRVRAARVSSSRTVLTQKARRVGGEVSYPFELCQARRRTHLASMPSDASHSLQCFRPNAIWPSDAVQRLHAKQLCLWLHAAVPRMNLGGARQRQAMMRAMVHSDLASPAELYSANVSLVARFEENASLPTGWLSGAGQRAQASAWWTPAASPQASRCMVIFDRHVHKNGGSSFRDAMVSLGGCEYFGYHLASRGTLEEARNFALRHRTIVSYEAHERVASLWWRWARAALRPCKAVLIWRVRRPDQHYASFYRWARPPHVFSTWAPINVCVTLYKRPHKR